MSVCAHSSAYASVRELLRHLLELLFALPYSAFAQECMCSDMRSNTLG